MQDANNVVKIGGVCYSLGNTGLVDGSALCLDNDDYQFFSNCSSCQIQIHQLVLKVQKDLQVDKVLLAHKDLVGQVLKVLKVQKVLKVLKGSTGSQGAAGSTGAKGNTGRTVGTAGSDPLSGGNQGSTGGTRSKGVQVVIKELKEI